MAVFGSVGMFIVLGLNHILTEWLNISDGIFELLFGDEVGKIVYRKIYLSIWMLFFAPLLLVLSALYLGYFGGVGLMAMRRWLEFPRVK